jgi:hypothetical protein
MAAAASGRREVRGHAGAVLRREVLELEAQRGAGQRRSQPCRGGGLGRRGLTGVHNQHRAVPGGREQLGGIGSDREERDAEPGVGERRAQLTDGGGPAGVDRGCSDQPVAGA